MGDINRPHEGRFGVQEAVCLTTITIGTKVFFTSPAFLTRFVGTAGWQMTLVSNITAIVAFTLFMALIKRFPGKDIIAIFHISLGRFFGFLFSIILAMGFLLGAGILMREFVDVIKVYVYPLTPIDLLLGVFVVAVALVSFLGIETIARVAKLSAYFLLIFYMLLLILAIRVYRITNLYPLLGYGVDQTLIHGIRRSSAYTEVMVLAVFAGSLQGYSHVRKAGYISLAIAGGVIAVGLFCFTLAFPVEIAQELTAPIYELARIIRYGAFLTRLDPLFLFIWIFSTLLAVSALFFSTVSIYAKTFRLGDTKPLIMPLALLLFSLAMFPQDFSSIFGQGVQASRDFSWAVFFGLPVVTLIVAVLRKKGGEG